MKNLIRKGAALLLLLTVIAGAGMPVHASSDPLTFNWGDGITASLGSTNYENDTLILSGSGTMSSAPSHLLSPDLAAFGIKHLIVNEGITTLGNNRFGSKGLESVTLPSNISITQGSLSNNNISTLLIKPGSDVQPNSVNGNPISRIEISSGVMFGENGLGFRNFYYANGQQGGIYVLNEGEWSMLPPSYESDITGDISALILSIDIPLTASFAIDPNAEIDTFVAPVLTISNNSNAPVKVGVDSFSLQTAGFTSVAPDFYADWDELTVSQSKNIAVGLKANEGWMTFSPDTLWADQVAGTEIGTIAANSTASLAFEAKHGRAFAETHTVEYMLSLSISLIN